jgi:allantoate deiminase
MERCDALGHISEEPNLLVRPYGSGAMQRANDTVANWMRNAGMTVRRDAVGNLIGRYEGTGDKTLILGSHLDTVRDAGKYDGILGVMVALACVEQLHDRGERLPFSIEVVAFADEEGLRFGTTFLGSSVYAGAFNGGRLRLEDENSVTLREAVRTFGGDPDALESAGRGNGDLLGYCEVDIEQGPVLEKLALPVGVVTGIMGKTTVAIEFLGKSGYAGIVSMTERKNALFAAAEFVLTAEETAQKEPGMVATVSQISVYPNAHGVIPGAAHLSLDLRHEDDSVRERALLSLRDGAEAIAAGRSAAMVVLTRSIKTVRRCQERAGPAIWAVMLLPAV